MVRRKHYAAGQCVEYFRGALGRSRKLHAGARRFLIGNRAGLELLKRKVDDALTSGECRVDEGNVEFVGIRVVEHDPRTQTAGKHGRFKDAVGLLGCGLLGFALMFIFIAGLKQIWGWMK
jgi:hypothetical protein